MRHVETPSSPAPPGALPRPASSPRARRVADASVPLLAFLVMMMVVSSASAQLLRLGAPRPPELDEDTYAALVAGELLAELDARPNPAADDISARATLLRAEIRYRLLIIDLLRRGDRARSDGSIAVITALALAERRDELFTALQPVVNADRTANMAGPTVDRLRSMQASLNRFNRAVDGFLAKPVAVDAATLDDELPLVLSGLAHAYRTISGSEFVSHWIDRDAAAVREVDLTALEERINRSPLHESALEALHATHAYLVEGAAFVEYRPLVTLYARDLNRLLQAAEIARDAAWLSAERRAEMTDRLERAAILFQTIDTRDEARALIARAELESDFIERLSRLSAPGAHRVHPRAIDSLARTGTALLAADGGAAGGTGGTEHRRRLIEVIDRMIAFRTETAGVVRRELRGDLRQFAVRLERAYLDREAALLTEIETIATRPSALADPAFLSLLQNHRQSLEDLERMRRLPDWVDAVSRANPRAVNGVETQLRRLAQDLLEPVRRQNAVTLFEQFERQVRDFAELPLEAALRAGEEEIASLTNGRFAAIAALIDEQRSRWAEGWARGEATGEAVDRLRLLRRLLHTIDDMGGLASAGGEATLLNRWSAWYSTPRVLGSAGNDLPNRVRLATQAMLTNNLDEVVRQLDRVDADLPLAALVGRLVRRYERDLAALPEGPRATLGRALFPPGPNAELLAERRTLADLCRYAIEARYAEGAGRAAVANAIRAYLHFAADDLLKRLTP